ncbi:hypothetical protein V8F20_012441 [Naviculisporaceae sp. PSN 640]
MQWKLPCLFWLQLGNCLGASYLLFIIVIRGPHPAGRSRCAPGLVHGRYPVQDEVIDDIRGIALWTYEDQSHIFYFLSSPCHLSSNLLFGSMYCLVLLCLRGHPAHRQRCQVKSAHTHLIRVQARPQATKGRKATADWG